MFRTIGVIVVLAALAFGLACAFGWMDFSGDAQITAKGQRQIRDLRNMAAEKIQDRARN